MRSLPTALLLGVIAAATCTTTALARPPQNAKITLGAGMAGAKVGQSTTALTSSGTIGPAPFSAWGRVQNGFCFEGSECAWTVPSGGVVALSRHPGSLRVLVLTATARGWRTSKDVGPGNTVATLRRRYPNATRITTCSLNSFGARFSGYRVGTRNLFETKAGKVDAVHVSLRKIVAEGPTNRC